VLLATLQPNGDVFLYSPASVTKSFHWLTALLIFTVIPLGIIANDLDHRCTDSAIPTTDAEIGRAAFLVFLHKTRRWPASSGPSADPNPAF